MAELKPSCFCSLGITEKLFLLSFFVQHYKFFLHYVCYIAYIRHNGHTTDGYPHKKWKKERKNVYFSDIMFIFATYNATFCKLHTFFKHHLTRNKEKYYQNSKNIS